jgi:hypothetical protein
MNVLKALRLSAVAGAILALLTLAMPTTASANVFNFSFTSESNPIGGFGKFTTEDFGNPLLVTGITGFVMYNGDTDAITGLSDFTGVPGLSADNLLSPKAPFVDVYGISFSTASLGDFNLYFEGKNWVQYSNEELGGIDPIALQVAAVPEASTWAMMILGFLGLGFLGYRRSSNFSGSTFRMA